MASPDGGLTTGPHAIDDPLHPPTCVTVPPARNGTDADERRSSPTASCRLIQGERHATNRQVDGHRRSAGMDHEPVDPSGAEEGGLTRAGDASVGASTIVNIGRPRSTAPVDAVPVPIRHGRRGGASGITITGCAMAARSVVAALSASARCA